MSRRLGRTIRTGVESGLRYALLRYPDVNPFLALEMFRSDRMRAGLGALTSPGRGRHRSDGTLVSNKKRHGPGWIVEWKMLRFRPARLLVPDFDLAEFGVWNEPAEELVKMEYLPERRLATSVQVPDHELYKQSGRDRAAWMLRNARRDLRAALDARS